MAGLILVWGILHLATAYFGYDGMEMLSYVAVPALLIVGLLSIWLATVDAGGLGGLMNQVGAEIWPSGLR